MQQMENERIKLAQAQEKIDAEKQKQLDAGMLKLTELEQQYGQQLEGEAASNRAAILRFDPALGDFV
jgi:hypothetical protein